MSSITFTNYEIEAGVFGDAVFAQGDKFVFGSSAAPAVLTIDAQDASAINTSLSGSLAVDGALNVTGDGMVDGDVNVTNELYVLGNVFLGIDKQQNGGNKDTVVFVGDSWGNTLAQEQLNIAGSADTGLDRTVLAVAGASDIRGTLTVAQASTLTGAATLGSTLAVTGAATLSDTLAVTSTATLGSTLAVTGDATFSANMTVSGDLQVLGAFTAVSATDVDIGHQHLDLHYATVTATNGVGLRFQEEQLASGSRGTNSGFEGHILALPTGIELKPLGLNKAIIVPSASTDTTLTFADIDINLQTEYDKLDALNTETRGSLTFTGANTSVAGSLTVGTTTSLVGAAVLSSSLTVAGATVLSDALTVNAASTLQSLAVTNNATVGGNLAVTGNLTVTGTIQAVDVIKEDVRLDDNTIQMLFTPAALPKLQFMDKTSGIDTAVESGYIGLNADSKVIISNTEGADYILEDMLRAVEDARSLKGAIEIKPEDTDETIALQTVTSASITSGASTIFNLGSITAAKLLVTAKGATATYGQVTELLVFNDGATVTLSQISAQTASDKAALSFSTALSGTDVTLTLTTRGAAGNVEAHLLVLSMAV